MQETQEKKFVQSVQLSEKADKKVDKNNQTSQQNKNRHYRYKKQRFSQSSKPVQANDDHIIFIHEDEDEKIPRTHIYSHNSVFSQFSQQTQTDHKDEECQSESSEWDVICCKLDKNCIVYFSQLGLITLCVSVSLYQIVSGSQSNRDFFIALLSSSLGYILPAPTLKKKNS
jgi:hypothetical protein